MRVQAVICHANRLLMMAMPSGTMALIGRGGAEILQHVNAHGTCAAALVPSFLDPLDQLPEITAFTKADLPKRIPYLRLEAHTGAPRRGIDISINKPAAHHRNALQKACDP